jgi:hypothetical protein
MTLRQKVAVAAVAACATLAAASPAAASRDQVTIFDATNDLLRANSAEAREATLDELEALGVDVVRVVVPWRGVVPDPGAARRPGGFDPTDPAAYEGGVVQALDQVVRGAGARGMEVLVSPSAPIPDWASASGRSAIESPRPAEYRQLLTGLGRRYDGTFGGIPCVQPLPPPLETIDCLQVPFLLRPIPRVGIWSMWNEPNVYLFLRPQNRAGRPFAGKLYRRLFLAGRTGLAASGHASDTILIGETAPSGGRRGTPPLDFMRQVLCAGCPALPADGWAHHPYDPGGTPFHPSSPHLLTIPSLGELSAALRRSSGSAARLPVYVTEYGVESVPDRQVGVSLSRQAEYLGIAEYSLWRNPRVRSYGQYLLTDDTAGFAFSFQSGLKLRDGRRKPAYGAFAIPLVVRQVGRGGALSFWGHVRPGSGPHAVEVHARGKGLIRRVTTNDAGYFAFRAPARGAVRWRATSPAADGRLLKGPWIRSYRFG